jgi:hypothetical protein
LASKSDLETVALVEIPMIERAGRSLDDMYAAEPRSCHAAIPYVENVDDDEVRGAYRASKSNRTPNE